MTDIMTEPNSKPKKWLTVAHTNELQPGEMKQVRVGKQVLALANVDGQFYAFGDTCPHHGFSLSESVLEGCEVSCALHAWTFDVRNGNPRPPLIETHIPIYDVKVEGSSIKVAMQ